jgi:hypothetical protein
MRMMQNLFFFLIEKSFYLKGQWHEIFDHSIFSHEKNIRPGPLASFKNINSNFAFCVMDTA